MKTEAIIKLLNDNSFCITDQDGCDFIVIEQPSFRELAEEISREEKTEAKNIFSQTMEQLIDENQQLREALTDLLKWSSVKGGKMIATTSTQRFEELSLLVGYQRNSGAEK